MSEYYVKRLFKNLSNDTSFIVSHFVYRYKKVMLASEILASNICLSQICRVVERIRIIQSLPKHMSEDCGFKQKIVVLSNIRAYLKNIPIEVFDT